MCIRDRGGKAEDLVHFFNEDGLGAIVNSSRGIIAAYAKEEYAKSVSYTHLEFEYLGKVLNDNK